MTKSTLAEGMTIAAIMATVLIAVSTVSLLLLMHPEL